MESLARLAQAITASLELPEVLQRIARAATDLVPDSRAGIWVVDGERIVLRAEAGATEQRSERQELAFGEGLTGHVAASRGALVVDDVASDPRVVNLAWMRVLGFVSFVGLPLLAGERLIGVLSLFIRHAHAVTLQELEILGAFADQAAVALENARLHAASVRRGQELTAMLRSVRSVMAERDLHRALERILEEAARISGVPNVEALLVDRETGTLRLAAARGTRGMPEAFALRLGEGLSGIVAATAQPLYSPDVHTDPRNVIPADPRHPVVSYLGLPITLADEVLGVLAFTTHEPRAHAPEERALLESFADHAALAIQNARLYEALERRLRRLQALTRLNQLISSSLDTEAVLAEISRAATALMDAPVASFWLADERTRTLALARTAGDAFADFPVRTFGFDDGILGAVARDRRLVHVPDVFTDDRVTAHAWWRAHGLGSFLGVPVVLDGALIAVLALAAARPFAIEAADLALLDSLTAQAAVAVRNARLFAATERRRATAESLADIGRDLAQSLEVDAVAQRIANSVHALLGGRAAGVTRVRTSGDVEVIAAAGSADQLMPAGAVVPRGVSVVALAVSEGCPVFTPDFLDDPRLAFPPGFIEQMMTAPPPYRAVLAVPLFVDDRPIGALWVADVEGRTFDDEEIRVVQTFADQAALALRNAGLLRETRRRQARLEALVEITRQMSVIQPLPTLLGSLADACARLLEATAVGFRIREGDELVAVDTPGGQRPSRTPRLRIGKSLSGIVAATGQVLNITDALDDPRLLPQHREEWLRFGYRAWLGIPVKIGDRVLGVLPLRTRRRTGFSDTDVAIATAFASQAAVAIENVRLYEEADRRRREAEELARVAQTLAETLDVAVLGQRIVDSVLALFGGRFSHLRLLQADGSLAAVAWAGPEPVYGAGRSAPPGIGLGARSVGEGRAVSSPDVLSDPAVRLDTELRDALTRSGVRSHAAAPLRAKGAIIGSLTLGDEKGRVWKTEELALLQTLADEAALALQNALLYAESERRRRGAEALLDIARALGSTLELPQVLRILTQRTAQAVGADRCVINLWRRGLIVPLTAQFADGHVEPERWRRFKALGPFRIQDAPAHRDAVTDKQPVVVDDLRAGPALPPEWRDALDTGALLVVPLLHQDEVIGTLDLDRLGGPYHWTQEQIDLARTIANQAALAVENARLFTAQREEAEVSGALLRLARAVEGVQGLDDVVTTIVRVTPELLGLTRCGLLLCEAPDGGVVPRAAWGFDEAHRARFFRLCGVPTIPAVVEAMRSQEPVVVGDAAEGTWLPERVTERFDIRSLLVLPLVSHGEPLGFMTVDTPGRPTSFDRARLTLARGVAAHAAVAIDRARLHDETARRTREAEVLAGIARTINAVLDEAWVLQRVTEGARDVCHSDGAAIALRDGGEDSFAIAYWTQGLEPDRTLRIRPGRGAGGLVLATGRPFRTGDYSGDPRITQDYASVTRATGTVAQMVVPIRIAERIEGLLYVTNRTSRPFTERDETILERVAEHAAVAIQNLQLFAREQAARAEAEASRERLQTRVRQQEMVAALGQLVLAGPDVETLMRDVVTRVAETLGVAYCNVFEPAPDGEDLRLRASSVETEPRPVSRGSRTPVALTLRSAEPVVLEDLAHDPRFPHTPRLRALGVVSGLAVPLLGREGGIGVLTALATTRREFSRDDVHFLQAVAHVLATALERQRADEALRTSEAQFRQSQKMEAVGRLAGGVAHDFNNLLTVIAGRSKLLLQKLSAADPLRRDVDLIDKTATRASALTRQLLTFSRKQVLQAKVIDLNAIVRGLASMLQRLLGEDMELVIEAAAPVARIKADPGQIEQLIVNLAVNARDAMPRGGRLTLRTATTVLDDDRAARSPDLRPGEWVVLQIADTGVGMDEATRSRIFEPFFTTKGVGEGTGLGLSTVYGIVRQHQGAIAVDTAPGRGTTFTVYLPPTPEATDAGDGAPPGARAARGSGTILLVEDDEEVRALARDILQQSGYTVLEAASPAEALTLCEAHGAPIHLMLTDVVMPLLSGPELAARLAPQRPAMKILYMSGYTDEAIGPRGLLNPDLALLQKPFTPDALVRRVRALLEDPPAS